MAYVTLFIMSMATLLLIVPSHQDGFSSIYRSEGLRGLYRGTSLALFGVSNGAIQFMGYEEMKRWGFEQKRKQFAKAGREWTPEDDKLVRVLVMSRSCGCAAHMFSKV